MCVLMVRVQHKRGSWYFTTQVWDNYPEYLINKSVEQASYAVIGSAITVSLVVAVL
jgi:hypothetical protein